MTETEKLALVAKVTDKIGREGKDVKSTFSTVYCFCLDGEYRLGAYYNVRVLKHSRLVKNRQTLYSSPAKTQN